MALGDHDEDALLELRRSIVIDPKFAVAHLDLGDRLRALGKFDEADAEYEEAMA